MIEDLELVNLVQKNRSSWLRGYKPFTYKTVYKKFKPHFFSKIQYVATDVPMCPHCKSTRLTTIAQNLSPHDSLGDTVYYKCNRCRFRFHTVEGDGRTYWAPMVRTVYRKTTYRKTVRRTR